MAATVWFLITADNSWVTHSTRLTTLYMWKEVVMTISTCWCEQPATQWNPGLFSGHQLREIDLPFCACSIARCPYLGGWCEYKLVSLFQWKDILNSLPPIINSLKKQNPVLTPSSKQALWKTMCTFGHYRVYRVNTGVPLTDIALRCDQYYILFLLQWIDAIETGAQV